MTYANHLLFIVQVVHIAAIPDIEHNAPHTIFANNMTATFNVVEACVQLNVKRFINISSEQVRVEPLPPHIQPLPPTPSLSLSHIQPL